MLSKVNRPNPEECERLALTVCSHGDIVALLLLGGWDLGTQVLR